MRCLKPEWRRKMDAILKPSPLSGIIPAIPSKSDAHRLLICAALCEGETKLLLRGGSQDIDATVDCLAALGAEILRCETGVIVRGIRSAKTENVLDCGESGSTLRFLLPVAAALGADSTLTGRGRLPQRPIDGLTEALSGHGVTISGAGLPLVMSGKLQPGVYEIPGNVSSQYITGLLLALPLTGGDCEIRLTSPLVSASYVDMTLSAMKRFGVHADRVPNGFEIPGGQKYVSPGTLQVEGDWSNAAFFLAAGAIGGEVTVTGLCASSSQPDARIFSLLRKFGATGNRSGDTYGVGKGTLSACGIDVDASPDLFPILAVTAAFSKGTTRLYNAARLRIKESDRIETTAAMIRGLGGRVSVGEDFLVVHGTGLSGGEISACGDHRIAMSAAVAAAFAAGETVLHGAEACRKSYPAFFDDFARLGGQVLLR